MKPRYKKGTKVEVMTRMELPSISWVRAEIISGNGHTYSVKYEPSPSGSTEHVERVSRKVIRPCPPVAGSDMNWVPGDVVEVFNNGSWKLAQVIGAVDSNYLSIRLLGSNGVFKIWRSDIRLRQCWEDNRWIVIVKEMGNSDNRELIKQGCLRRKDRKRIKGFHVMQKSEESTAIEDSEWVHLGKRRFQSCSPQLKMFNKNSKKKKACDEEGMHEQLTAANTCHFQEKVDAVASPENLVGEEFMCASVNNKILSSELDWEGRPYGCSFGGSSEPSDASICSSSDSNDLDILYHYPFRDPCLNMDSLSEDADSSCWSKVGEEQSFVTKDDLAAKIHELELCAYRTTMKALYSSGSITWEQEEMMTNLRLNLHISNDEHLLELRHLLSSKLDLISRVDKTSHLL